MAQLFSLKVGDKKLQRALNKLQKGMQAKFVRKAMRESTKVIQREAIQLVSRRQGENRSGRRIKVRVAKKRKRGEMKFVIMSAPRKLIGIGPSEDVYYPAIQEYGSVARGITPLEGMQTALKNKEGAAVREFGTVLWKQIRAVR